MTGYPTMRGYLAVANASQLSAKDLSAALLRAWNAFEAAWPNPEETLPELVDGPELADRLTEWKAYLWARRDVERKLWAEFIEAHVDSPAALVRRTERVVRFIAESAAKAGYSIFEGRPDDPEIA